jgi:flagellin
MLGEQFNGINLFTAGGGDVGIDNASLQVVTSQDGEQKIDISKLDLGAVGGFVGTASGDGTAENITIDPDTVFTSATGAAAAISNITLAIQTLAELRATNGSEQVRLTFAADMLAINKTNLEAANGRITDVDIASESANLARLNILQQAGTAMLAQANQANQSVLRLLV